MMFHEMSFYRKTHPTLPRKPIACSVKSGPAGGYLGASEAKPPVGEGEKGVPVGGGGEADGSGSSSNGSGVSGNGESDLNVNRGGMSGGVAAAVDHTSGVVAKAPAYFVDDLSWMRDPRDAEDKG
jgi:hypothetical protein